MLKIYNTLGRELQEFKPINPGKVMFYHCGPTVYWTQHIGNMRAMVLSDLIRRSFSYLGYEVTQVRNYTDVGHLTDDGDEGEDKMEVGAKREGLSPQQIADKYIQQFEADITSLNIMHPDAKPRATEYINQMIDAVRILLEKGYAYATPKAIYYDISKFASYTELSGQKLEANIQGAGKAEVEDPDKRNPADFAIWVFKTGKHARALQYWASPFESEEVNNGEGFPGWHLECSVMANTELAPTIDVHMGGIEHIPVHHPNEIAQSEAINDAKFVNYWLHNEHLLVDGSKMAKSEGTSYVVQDVVDQGFEPIVLRYFFLQAHYRSKQNFTWEALTSAQTAYQKMLQRVQSLYASIDSSDENLIVDEEFNQRFVEALQDDFNIPQALAVAWDMLKSDLADEVKVTTMLNFDLVLGLELESRLQDPTEVSVPDAVQDLLDERAAAREDKDWEKSDMLRDLIRAEFGYIVKDTADGQQLQKA